MKKSKKIAKCCGVEQVEKSKEKMFARVTIVMSCAPKKAKKKTFSVCGEVINSENLSRSHRQSDAQIDSKSI